MKKNILLLILSLATLVTAASTGKKFPQELPLNVVPMNRTTITVDGVIDEQEWSDASKMAGCINIKTIGEQQEPISLKTENDLHLYMKSDDKNLYVAWVAERNFGEEMVTKYTDNSIKDQPLWQDDCVELILLNKNLKKGLLLIINAQGAIYDGQFHFASGNKKVTDSKFNYDWKRAVKVYSNRWQGEIVIPLSTLGKAPEAGEEWGLNFKNYQHSRMWKNWSASTKPWCDRPGRIVFSPDFNIQINKIGKLNTFKGGLNAIVGNSGKPANITVECELYTNSDQANYSMIFPDIYTGMAHEEHLFMLDKERMWQLNQNFLLGTNDKINIDFFRTIYPKEKFLIRYRIKNNDQLLAIQDVPFENKKQEQLELNIRKYLISRNAFYVFINKLIFDEHKNCQKINVVMHNKTNSIEKTFDAPQDKHLDAEVKLENTPPGKYNLTVTLVDAKGSAIVANEQEITIPEKPEWLDNTLGVTDKVLEPWTAIEYKDKKVSLLGRSYSFNNGILPSEIDSWGTQILAKPIELVAKVEDKNIVLKPVENVSVLEQDDAHLIMQGKLKADNITANVTVLIEFDGLLKVDFELIEKPENLSGLYLNIPYKKECSNIFWRSFHGVKPLDDYDYKDWPWGGETPKEGLSFNFTPILRLQNGKAGMEWWAESPKNWHLTKDTQPIKVIPNTDNRMLEITFINRKLKPSEKTQYTWGLFAMPPKQNESSWGKFSMAQGNLTRHPNYTKTYEAYLRPTTYWLHKRPSPKEFEKGICASYPLRENIQGEAGTLTMEVIFPHEKAAEKKSICWLDLGNSDGIHLYSYFNDKNNAKKIGFTGCVVIDGKKYNMASANFDYDITKLYSVKLTWNSSSKDTTLKLSVDNKIIATTTIPKSLSDIDFNNNFLLLGGDTQIIFDRIELGDSKGKVLIKDEFNTPFVPNDYLQTTADIISGKSTETGAQVDIFGEFVKVGSGYGLKLSTNRKMHYLELLKARGTKQVYAHCAATRADYNGSMYIPDSPDTEKILIDWVKKIQSYDMKAVIYQLKGIAMRDKYFNDYGYEMAVKPIRVAPNHYVLCPQKAGCDFIVWSTTQILKNFGVDNFNLDYAGMWPCMDLKHGCGFIDDDGEAKVTFPFLAHRRMNRRLYGIQHGVGGIRTNGYYFPHISQGGDATYLSFADGGMTGEQEGFLYKRQTPLKSMEERMTPERYMSHYSRQITGVNSACKGNGGLKPFGYLNKEDVMQWHTYIVSPFGTTSMSTHSSDQTGLVVNNCYDPYANFYNNLKRQDSPKFISPQAMYNRVGGWLLMVTDDFKDAELIDFFNSEKYYKLDKNDDKVKISFFKHPDNKRLLMIVGNATTLNIETTISLNLKELGFEEPIVRDILTRDVFDGNLIKCDIPGEFMRMYIITNNKK